MKTLRLFATMAALAALCATAVSAHHSAQQFDFGRSVPISGVVKRFQSINPHMRLVITVTDAKGTRDRRNRADGIFRQSGHSLLLAVTEGSPAYSAKFDIGLDLTP